jgi:sulfate adenylyltransferase
MHITPHGGSLVNLMMRDNDYKKALIESCHHIQECSERNACDVELLTVGGFSPLDGFLNKDAYEHVVQHMRCDSACSWAHQPRLWAAT